MKCSQTFPLLSFLLSLLGLRRRGRSSRLLDLCSLAGVDGTRDGYDVHLALAFVTARLPFCVRGLSALDLAALGDDTLTKAGVACAREVDAGIDYILGDGEILGIVVIGRAPIEEGID